MKKMLLVLTASLLFLSACQKTPEYREPTFSTSRDQHTEKTTNYFHYLADSYQKALSHEKESKDTTVQSPMAATFAAMEELQLFNPTDQALIMKNYSDFQKLIQYNTEKWEEEFTSWASSMGQSYHRLEQTNFDEKNELIKKLATATVSQKSVKWNVFGVSPSNDYDYLVLDVYYDNQDRHVYLFTLKDGQVLVLYAEKTLETVGTANFEVTENTDLSQRFRKFFDKVGLPSKTKPVAADFALLDRIKEAMKSYADSRGELVKSTSLAIHGSYYGLAVPEQIMQFGNVDGVQYTFKWYDYVAGNGSGQFDILACYVNEAGTEVIMFGYKDGIPLVLHTDGQPEIEKDKSGVITNASIHFVVYHHPKLNQVFN